MGSTMKYVVIITTTLVIITAIVVAIAVPLSKRDDPDKSDRELAEQLMSDTPLIDGHNDLPFFLKINYDNRLEDIDLSEDRRGELPTSHTDIARLREGKVGAQFWAAFTLCDSQYKDSVTHVLDQIDVIKRMCKKYPEDFEFVTSAQGIIDAFEAGKIGSLIGVEGGHNIDSFPSVMRMLAELGVRYMTLTHSCNTPWADNWKTDTDEEEEEFGGLTEWGEKLVLEMNRIGVFVDLSHVSKSTMVRALEISRAPVIFSHSSAFSVCNSYRNVQDDVFPLVRENGGVIMVNFYTKYVNCPPMGDNKTNEAELVQVADHIDYLAQECGHDYVGIGGDYDGVNTLPNGLEDVSKYPDLIAELIHRGWTDENIRKLLGENLLRAMREMEEVRDRLANELPLEENMPRDSGGEAENSCRIYYYDNTS